jgi:hypothetical protein
MRRHARDDISSGLEQSRKAKRDWVHEQAWVNLQMEWLTWQSQREGRYEGVQCDGPKSINDKADRMNGVWYRLQGW